jgi:glycerophosphoryl diester phosphodiesterase
MPDAPHPDSLVVTPDRRAVYLKVHRCLWSGDYPENSLAAIQECYRARVARAEIDVNLLLDADFLVTHDPQLEETTSGSGLVSQTTRREAQRLRCRWRGGISDHRPPLLSEVIGAIRDKQAPTLLELDAKDFAPWPWPRVEELARLLEPAKERVILNGCADWNLRRLLELDPSMPVGFDPAYYFDWAPPGASCDPLPGVRGAYGYLDAHPLARQRLSPTADYLRDRLRGLIRLVPEARELHLRLETFERMLDDGFSDLARHVHQAGVALDVWTLDAETPRWRRRIARAVAAGVDIITTNTPHALAACVRAGLVAETD